MSLLFGLGSKSITQFKCNHTELPAKDRFLSVYYLIYPGSLLSTTDILDYICRIWYRNLTKKLVPHIQ